jgi:hypothetical protein
MEFTDEFGKTFKAFPQIGNLLMVEIGDGKYLIRAFLDEAALIDLKVQIDAALRMEDE